MTLHRVSCGMVYFPQVLTTTIACVCGWVLLCTDVCALSHSLLRTLPPCYALDTACYIFIQYHTMPAYRWYNILHPILSLSLTFPILYMRMCLLLLCASHMKESSKGCLYWCKKLWHSIECPVEWYISHGFPPPQLHVLVVGCCWVMMCVPMHAILWTLPAT